MVSICIRSIFSFFFCLHLLAARRLLSRVLFFLSVIFESFEETEPTENVAEEGWAETVEGSDSIEVLIGGSDSGTLNDCSNGLVSMSDMHDAKNLLGVWSEGGH